MPSKKKKQNQSRQILNAFNPNTRLKQIVAFVLVFMFIGGGIFLYKSHAATCRDATFSYSTNYQGQCVNNIQYILNGECAITSKTNYADNCVKLSIDGYYGWQTTAQVQNFQRFVGVNPDGKVRPQQTWPWLCSAGKSSKNVINNYDTIHAYYAAVSMGC